MFSFHVYEVVPDLAESLAFGLALAFGFSATIASSFSTRVIKSFSVFSGVLLIVPTFLLDGCANDLNLHTFSTHRIDPEINRDVPRINLGGRLLDAKIGKFH